ncbi:DUF7382 domain-containing protein [Halovenus halobia]|uniref:DUF7382 domain-containing protein n=1 Tax=Halovenus halobia TaxID=3396622 RepID=UPI003F564AF3
MFSPFRADERAVEGMPIRLVVAVTVGIAAFSLLVPMADSVEQADRTELTVEPEPRQVLVESADESATVRVDVVTTDGAPVAGATVLVSGRSLPVDDGPIPIEAGADGYAEFTVGTDPTANVTVSFRSRQHRGTLQLHVRPPPSSEYRDNLDNPGLTVRRED